MFYRELETERLFLRNISIEDREFIFSQFSNNEVTKYLYDAQPVIDIQGADEIINDYLKPEPRGHHRWIIVRKNDNKKIGTCGFHCWDTTLNQCDIGYDLYPDFQRMGYMFEALQEIINFAWNDMKVTCINACIYVDNLPSIRLVEKLGFVYNGQVEDTLFRGTIYHHRIYNLKKTEN
jgi:ribosomal-protein-alanine N-acetyltransferase